MRFCSRKDNENNMAATTSLKPKSLDKEQSKKGSVLKTVLGQRETQCLQLCVHKGAFFMAQKNLGHQEDSCPYKSLLHAQLHSLIFVLQMLSTCNRPVFGHSSQPIR